MLSCGFRLMQIPTAGWYNRNRPIKTSPRYADMERMQDRRSEARMLCADMVDVSWMDRQGRTRRATALLEDISRSGACLQFEVPVPLEVMVQVACANETLEGKVRYCEYREIGYFVGVEFAEGSKWDPRQFEPQHLLDLERLLDQKKPPRGE